MGLGQHICLSQPAFHSAGRMPVCAHHNHMMLNQYTQHNDYFMLHFTPTSFLICHLILFSRLFFCPPSSAFSSSLSLFSVLDYFPFSHAELSVIFQRCNLSFPVFLFFFFILPAALSFQYNSRSHNRAL